MIYRKKKIAIAIVTVLLVLLSAYQFNCMLQSYCAISHHLEKKRLLQIITDCVKVKSYKKKKEKRILGCSRKNKCLVGQLSVRGSSRSRMEKQF